MECIERLLKYQKKLKEQLDYEWNTVMQERLRNAIAYIDSWKMEISDTVRNIEWNCERILSGK